MTRTLLGHRIIKGTITAEGLIIDGQYALPTIDGTSGQILVTNGVGVVTWEDSDFVASVDSVNGNIGDVTVDLQSALSEGNIATPYDILMRSESIKFGGTDLVQIYEDGAGVLQIENTSGATAGIGIFLQNGTTNANIGIGLNNMTLDNSGLADTGLMSLNFALDNPELIFQTNNVNGNWQTALKSLTPTADRLQSLQDKDGVIALLSDITAHDGNGIYTNNGVIGSNRVVTTNAFTITFDAVGDSIGLDPNNNKIVFKNPGIGAQTGNLVGNVTGGTETWTLPPAKTGTIALISDLPVIPAIPTELDDLTDVDTTTTLPVIGDALVYGGSPGEWTPQKPKRTWAWEASRNGNVTNSYLISGGGTFTNTTPYIVAFDCKLTAISASTNGVESWNAEIHVNGVNIAALVISAASKEFASPLNISISAGDEVSFYCTGTGINRPMITGWFNEE